MSYATFTDALKEQPGRFEHRMPISVAGATRALWVVPSWQDHAAFADLAKDHGLELATVRARYSAQIGERSPGGAAALLTGVVRPAFIPATDLLSFVAQAMLDVDDALHAFGRVELRDVILLAGSLKAAHSAIDTSDAHRLRHAITMHAIEAASTGAFGSPPQPVSEVAQTLAALLAPSCESRFTLNADAVALIEPPQILGHVGLIEVARAEVRLAARTLTLPSSQPRLNAPAVGIS